MWSWRNAWIIELDIPWHIAEKISLKHGLDVQVLEELLVENHRLLARRVSDSQHGSREELSLQISKKNFLIGFADITDKEQSIWRLRTMRVSSQNPQKRRG